DEPSLLAVIIDTNPLGWTRLGHGQQANEPSTPQTGVAVFTKALRQLLVFLNAFMALDTRNRLLVLAAHPGHRYVHVVDHSHNDAESAATTAPTDQSYPPFNEMNQQIWTGIQRLYTAPETTELAANAVDDDDDDDGVVPSMLTICVDTNRVLKGHSAVRWQPRTLIISASEDVPSQYTPLMNCIFSAQRSVGRTSAFLSDVQLREHLYLPNREEVDFRAACFCHRRIINIGYVCSVCLSIFCDATDTCTTCRTPFSTKPIIMPPLDRPSEHAA
ncbi:TFIIH subunit Tfb4/p34, partial [Syncephalis pseudoplumigaleata]